MANRTFAFSYSKFSRVLLGILGTGPAFSNVTVSDVNVRVRMGWAFSATIPRAQIVSATPDRKPALMGYGVHGWRGKWAVNGSDDGIVKLTISPEIHARTVGIFAITLRELYLSLEDADGFLASLNG